MRTLVTEGGGMSTTHTITRGPRSAVTTRRHSLAGENERLRAELRAARARTVAECDELRRRIERDLHDGAQQRFVAIAMIMRMARTRVGEHSEAAALIDQSLEELAAGLSELRALARGILPAILSDCGLEPALLALAGRTPMPVACSIDLQERLPCAIETAAYFLVAEALTNVVRHAGANAAEITVHRDGTHVGIEVRDDGSGGVDAAAGSGLRGLADRISALDGHLYIENDAAGGTLVRAEIPVPRT
jgi:signal transduction histidine kinase